MARHARARHCRVVLRADGPALALTVTDDGIRIQLAGAGAALACARCERAEELSGAVAISTAPDGGTVLRVRLPLAAAVGAP